MLEEHLRTLNMVPVKSGMINKPSPSCVAPKEVGESDGLGRSEEAAPWAVFGRVSGDISSRPLSEPSESGMDLSGTTVLGDLADLFCFSRTDPSVLGGVPADLPSSMTRSISASCSLLAQGLASLSSRSLLLVSGVTWGGLKKRGSSSLAGLPVVMTCIESVRLTVRGFVTVS